MVLLEAKSIILLMDILYASKSVMDIYKENKWDYIIRFKDGSIPYISKECEAIHDKEQTENAEYINEIEYE